MSTVTISTLEELKAFRDAVNNGNSCKGQTVELSADIDLKGEEWTPIGKSGSTFQGVFNGNGHTVSNLVINQPGMRDVGFFGVTTDGEIKNLTIHNADVKGYLDVGAVAGTPYTSKYTNIKLTGDVKVEGYAYVGGMFGKNAYANLTGLTIDANSGSYVKAESEGWRTYVGGVIGFMGEGGHTVQDVTSNLNVIGSTCDVGGIVGIAHYGNKFINVTCTAENITLKNAQDAGDEQEIGGIAGVWNNSDSKTVLMINCSAENTTLKSALLGEDKSEEVKGNTVTGKSYSGETATSGTLLVGKETQTENGTALTFTVSGPKAAEDLEKAFGPLQTNEDGTFTAQTTYLVRIGGAYYDTLDAALAAAKNGDTLTLLGNITLDSMLTVGKDITIDGAGQYSFTASENDTWKGQQMIQVSKANVTFKDLTLDGAGQSLTLIQAAAATGLTLDGVTMQNARNGIYKGSTFDNGGVTISNSTINVKVYAFNASGKLAFVNVSGSTLYGWTSYDSSLTDASGSFKDTKFFEADDRGLNGIVAALRPYFPTVVDNCQFSEAFSMTTGDYYNENGLSIGKSNVVMNLDKVSVIKADGSASDIPLADLVSSNFEGSGGSAVSDVAFVVDGIKDESGKYSGGTFIGDSAVIASTLAEGLAPKANEDGTYSAATPDMTNILVNSGWTSMKPGEVIPGQDGFNFGFNAFDSMDGILAKYATDATANTATSKIILNSDAENNSATTGKVYLYTNSDLAFAADGTPRTATFHGSRLYLMNVYQLDGEHKPVKNEFIPTITIEEGVSLVTDKMLMVGQNVDQDDIDTDGNPTRDPAAVNLVVNGTLTTELYVASLSSVTVNKTGKVLVGYKEAFITRSSSTVTVNGTGSKDDVQFAVNYTSMQGGILNLNDTSMTTGMLWLNTSPQGFVVEGSTLNAKNSKIASSQSGTVSDKSGITLSDGSEITMAGKLENNGSIQIANSTLSVSTLTNNGTINITGNSTVNIGTTSGNGAFNLNGANLTDSRIGNAEVYGDVTANNLEAGNISVGFGRYTAANASLDLSGSVKANIIYVGVKTVEGDAPYANFSYALNIHDAQGDIGTVNARTTGTLTISSSELNIGDLLIRNQTEIIDSNITGKFGSGGTGHWAIYEDDDSSRTASLTVTGSTLNTNYICIGKNINGQYEADSNAKLTLTDSTFIADSYIYLMKNTAGFTTGITMQNFSVLQAKTIYNGSEIRMNHNSTIKFSGEYISDGGSIVVDMTGAKAGGFFKLIDYTGADPASVNYQNVTLLNGNGYSAVTMNGDLYASNADMSVIQVNSAWAGNAPGTEVAEGYYFGFNAFDNANDAINAAGANATVRIQGTGEDTTPITRKSYMENLTVETPEGGSSHLCMHAGSTTYVYGEEAENGDAVRHEATVEYKNQDISFAGHSHFESLAGMTVKFTGSKVGHDGGTPFFKVYGDSNVVFDNSTYNAKNGNLWFYVSGQLDLQKNSLLNIETGSGFRILAAGGKVNVDESGLTVSNTNITIGSYYIYGDSDKTAKAIVGGKKQGHDADSGNDYSATLNITNGRLVNKNGFVRVGASYILDDAATDKREGLTIKANPDKPADYADLAKAYLNITGSSAADLNELYVDGNGIVTVQDSSKLTAKAVTVDGKLTVSHGSAMTVSGVLSVSGDSNAGRGITVDGTGFTSGTKAVISAGSIVWNKNILASGLETGMTLAVTNNAVYLTDQNQDTVHVGGKNADGVPEANGILDAVNAIGMTPDKTVFDFGNAAKTYTGTLQNETDKVEFTQAGKYTFTGGELAHLPYLHGNAADAELVFDKAKLTLSKVKMEKGSSLTVMDSQLDFHPHSGDLAFLSLYNDGIMNVAGSVVGISDEMNDTDMPKAGKAGNSDTNGVYLAKDGMSRVSLTIQGQVNMTDSTLFASYRSRVLAGTRGQGEMNLKNSVMYADGLQILQATEDTGKATVNLDASALIQSHYSSSASLYSLVIGNDEAANAAAVISLTNGSLLDWSKAATTRMPYEPWPDSDSVVINTNGTLEIKGNSTAKTGNITNAGAIVIDNGKLEAAAVANNGTFSVSGTVDLSGSFSGNVFNFAAGSVLTSSKGFSFDGDYVTDSLTAIGAGEFSFGKLRFNVDKANPKSVDVKIGKNAVVKVSNVMEIDRRTAKDPDAVDENIAGILTLEDGAKVTVGTETAKGWFYNKFEASTNISKGAELNVYGEFQNKGYFTVNGTLNLYSVFGLGMTAAGREDKGGIMNIDGGVVNYSDTEASKGWFGIGTKRQNNPTWDDATDTKTSELNITNGGQLNINLLEGNPYDTAFGIGQYGKLSVTGEGAAVNAASAGLQNNGEILLQNKANMTLGKLISNGTITVSNSTLAVSGDLTLNGSFSFDLASTITVGNLTNSGTITIDMNNVEAGQMFKLIDHTGTGTGSSYGDVTLINNAGSYRTIVIDNDLYALNVDMSVLKVNAAWAGTAAGTKVAEGYYLGINAFDALSATTGNIAKDGSDTTIEIGSDLTASGELEFDHGSGKVIFTAGSEGEKVINTGDVVFENKVNANIVVGKDVTFNIADNNNDFAVYYGNNLDLYGTIKGGQNYGSLYLYQGDHTIHAEGTLATGRLHSRYDSVTVLGAEGETRRYAEDVAVADRTDAQVNINFLFQESGTFAAKDTFVNVGAANGGDGHGIYDSNKGSVRDTNAPVFNFANTKLNAYQIQLQRGETTFGADGSVITITAEFNTNGTVNLTNTKLTVGKTLTNTGSFSFDLASTVTVGGLVNSSTITVDMTGASSDLALLIDYTGNGVMTLEDYGSVTLSDANYSTMVINNDLYAISTSLDLTHVAVNAAWAGSATGAVVAEGKYFGLNAFDTTDNLSGLSAMKTLSITDTTAGGALDLTKFGSRAMTAVNSTLTDLALANSSSLNMDGSSTAGNISAAGSLTINGDAAVNTVKTAAADAELNINGLTVNQGISGFTTISTGGVSVKKGGITLTAGNDVMNVNGMLISMADGIDFLDGSNSLTLSSAASVVAYGIYATNGSLDLTLTLADNVGKAIITVADDGIFADAASTISLDVSKLQVGSYILVNNLSSFSKRIQVNGDTLGIGESLNINGMRYTLNYSNKTLSLDVTDFIVGNDIDNNGYADILMFNQKKEAALWLMKSNGTAEWKELFPFAGGDIADGWTLFDTGDTTGNNYSDVILYNEQDKDVGVWQMSDGETTWRTLERLDSDHELVAVRDFNGNGKRDILSRGTDGSIQFHYTDSGKTERFELSNDWKIVGAGDINGDGKADVIFQNGTKTGAWLTGAENEMPQWRDLYDLGTADNSILGTGDFDGNGIADVLIATKNSNGTVSYGTWLMNAQTEAQWRTLVTLPASVVIESISDINGDGKAELRVRNGNDIASISMSVSLDSSTVLTQWNSHGPVTDEWTTKLASPIL